MGYTTLFKGEFIFNKPLTLEQKEYISRFCSTRRMKRDVEVLQELHGGKHSIPNDSRGYGIEGEFFALDDGDFGQSSDKSIISYNIPPKTQPGLWCQWQTDGEALFWDGGEKFYRYVEWLEYLIENFFKPWGVELNGEVQWRGEDFDDLGVIMVENNNVETKSLLS